MPPGHQIVKTGLIKLYRITGKEAYLALAKFFLDQRGNAATHALYGAYSQDHLPVTEQRSAQGHAVRAMYQYAGMADIAALYAEPRYRRALDSLWENVTTKKMCLTGGVGATREGEAFGKHYELLMATAYAETCAAIGAVHWNQRMFLLTGEAKYYDVLERTLYNGLLAGISLRGSEFFYPNPMAADGLYKFNRGACTRQAWFDCSCCPTNLVRFLPSLPGLVYATRAEELFVNLFVASKVRTTVGNTLVALEQQTCYPWQGDVRLPISPAMAARFTLRVRIPGWARHETVPGNLYSYATPAPAQPIIKVNGRALALALTDGYASITRRWRPGDVVTVHLPLAVRLRWSRSGGQKKDVYFFCDDSQKERSVAR